MILKAVIIRQFGIIWKEKFRKFKTILIVTNGTLGPWQERTSIILNLKKKVWSRCGQVVSSNCLQKSSYGEFYIVKCFVIPPAKKCWKCPKIQVIRSYGIFKYITNKKVTIIGSKRCKNRKVFKWKYQPATSPMVPFTITAT